MSLNHFLIVTNRLIGGSDNLPEGGWDVDCGIPGRSYQAIMVIQTVVRVLLGFCYHISKSVSRGLVAMVLQMVAMVLLGDCYLSCMLGGCYSNPRGC